jgi:hypothetical protein
MSLCDFCGSPDVRWTYPARDFAVREQGIAITEGPTLITTQPFDLTQVSDGGWDACPACSALIERSDRERLARRCAKRIVRDHPGLGLSLHQATADARAIHDDFWSHREGQRVPAS